MSSNLLWRPIKPETDHDLPTAVKFILRKRYGEPIRTVLAVGDIPYLQGLLDTGLAEKELTKLIEAIEEYRAVELWEQY